MACSLRRLGHLAIFLQRCRVGLLEATTVRPSCKRLIAGATAGAALPLARRSILPTENAGGSEVYVDQVEAISCTLGAAGDLVVAACHGTLQMKSYMAHGSLTAMLKMHSFHCAELAPQYAFMQGGTPCPLADLQLHQAVQLQPTRARPPPPSAAACA